MGRAGAGDRIDSDRHPEDLEDKAVMTRKIINAFATVALLLGLGASMVQPAEAHRRGGLAAGLAIGTVLGLGIAGAYAGPRYYGYDGAPGCYRGPRQCGWVGRSCWINRHGEQICSGGYHRCWHPTICD
jgi:hypothetical protein